MRRLIAAAFALGLLSTPVSFGHAAAASAVPSGVADRELVVVHLDADGGLSRATLVDALTVRGSGRVEVTDTAEPAGFRNLGGFDRPSFDGRRLTWTLDLDGSKEVLTAASAEGPFPASVTPRYLLDGVRVPARALRGATGDVAVEYDLRNLTRETRELPFTDASGRATTGPLETYVPFVAQVQLDLDSAMWERISAPGGRIVTDDNGIHHVSWSPILSPIIGAPDQTVRLEGRVRDLELAGARVVFVPLAPPGADTARRTSAGAAELYQGLGEIDGNLIRLRDGTRDLMDGLTRIRRGIAEARSGAGKAGEDDTIVDGLAQVLGGLENLGDSAEGLPAAQAAVALLAGGVEEILAGLGAAATDDTVLGGLADVGEGLADTNAGIDAIVAGLDTIAATLGDTPADAATAPDATTTARNDVERLKDLALLASATCDALAAGACSAAGADLVSLATAAGFADAKIDGARDGVLGVKAGLESGDLAAPGVSEGLTLLGLGVGELIDGVEEIKAGLSSGDAASPGVLEGLEALGDGIATAVAGIGTVGDTDTLTDGVHRLLDGSEELAGGLARLEEGAGDAEDGAGTIAEGQGRLSTEGVRAAQTGVGEGLLTASQSLAVLEDMAERAESGASIYGPPEGAESSVAYVYEIRGIDERARSTALMAAVAGLALAALVFLGSVARPSA